MVVLDPSDALCCIGTRVGAAPGEGGPRCAIRINPGGGVGRGVDVPNVGEGD